MILRYLFAWIPMVFLAILNGAIREFSYGNLMSTHRAHQLSSFTAIILFGGYTWLLSVKWPLQSSKQAIVVGLIWLFLTIAFEFVFGHYVAHQNWRQLLENYNILAGRLWPMVLLAITFLPLAIFKLRD